MTVIEAKGISKGYRGRALYEDASFTIPAGKITSIVGPNGAGKSVLFRLMCGFVNPDAGKIDIDPSFLSKGRTFPEKFGIIIDRPGYLAGRTGLRNLQDLARIRNEIGDEEIKSTMREIGLDPDLKQKVRHYSLGMKQKLALAQALMESPSVLLLDEPFNALDADSVTAVKNKLIELNRQGVTVVFTSHNPLDVDELADRVLAIEDGKITLRSGIETLR